MPIAAHALNEPNGGGIADTQVPRGMYRNAGFDLQGTDPPCRCSCQAIALRSWNQIERNAVLPPAAMSEDNGPFVMERLPAFHPIEIIEDRPLMWPTSQADQ